MTTARYIERIQEAAQGEVLGEILFLKLADRYVEHRHKLEKLILLEVATAERMRGLLARHDITLAETANAEAWTDRLIASSPLGTWYEFLRWMHGIVTIYVGHYDRMFAEALESDRADLGFLAKHERALLEFLDAEIAEDPQSLAAIDRILEDNKRHSGAVA